MRLNVAVLILLGSMMIRWWRKKRREDRYRAAIAWEYQRIGLHRVPPPPNVVFIYVDKPDTLLRQLLIKTGRHPNEEALKEGIRQRLDEADREDTVLQLLPAIEVESPEPTPA